MITKFAEEYFFLSNFFPFQIVHEGLMYPTAEHAYQAAKTNCKLSKIAIQAAATPGIAKRMGSKVILKPYWDTLRVQTMYDILDIKFAYPILARKLVATGIEDLIEGNNWGDKFWGAVLEGDTWVGANMLGKLLMHIRFNLRTGGSNG